MKYKTHFVISRVDSPLGGVEFILLRRNFFSSEVGVSSQSPKLLSITLLSQIISKFETKILVVNKVLFNG